MNWCGRLALICATVLAVAFAGKARELPAQTEPAIAPAPEKHESLGKPDELRPEDLRAHASSFAVVKIFFRRGKEDSVDSDDWESPEREKLERYSEYIDQKRPMRMGAVVVAPKLLLTFDFYIDDEYLDRIEVETLDGGTAPAVRLAALVNAPGMLFEVEEAEKLGLRPPDFAPAPASFALSDSFHTIQIRERGVRYFLGAGGGKPASVFGMDGPALALSFGGQAPYLSAQTVRNPYYERMLSAGEIAYNPALILDSRRRPIGIGLADTVIQTDRDSALWRIESLIKDKRLNFTDWARRREETRQRFDGLILEAKIEFRQDVDDPSEERYSRRVGWGDDEDAEKYVYGLPISDKWLFVPERMERDQAKIIDSVTVFAGDKEYKARFLGAFKDIVGYVLEIEEGKLPYDKNLLAADGLPEIQPLVSLRAERKFGAKRLDVRYDRFMGLDRGYKDVLEPVPMLERQMGTYFLGSDQKIHAVLLGQRKEDEDKERFREGEMSYYYSGQIEFRRVFTMRELESMFQRPESHFDKTIVWLPEEDQKRKMWLGVEFQPINKDLARAWDVQKQTRDGSIGLIVSEVYPDSPAEKLGLRVGDILLRMKEKDAREPVELKDGGRDNYSRFFWGPDPYILGDYREMRGMPPWSNRRNLITELLEVIGEGKTVSLTWLDSKRRETTKNFQVELAPPDFSNAPKFKDKAVGLTVRELTYEVRHSLLLPKDQKGVVIAEIESGSPASIARVGFYEIIPRIDNQPVKDLEGYKKIMEAAKKRLEKEDQVTLRFTLQYLDKTHFSDVTLRKSDIEGQ